MLEQTEFDLQWEDRRCVIDQLGAKDARHVAARLLQVLGEALASADIRGDMAEVAAAGALISRAKPELLDWLTDTFLKVTKIERDPGEENWASPKEFIDLVFGGGYGLKRWLRWLVFCVEHSCAPFFSGLFEEGARLQTRVRANGSQKSSPRPGFSTESPPVGNTRTA